MKDIKEVKSILFVVILMKLKIYVGSTIDTLTNRSGYHKKDCKREKKTNVILYKAINGNSDDWYFELLELWPCGSKAELTQQEGKHIRKNSNLNKVILGRIMKEYYIDK